jgi:predicted nuclease of restriction endonuclease-like (RecB) superfamily
MQVVNKELIYMYWHIGKIILDNFKWGNKFIDNLSIDLKMEFPNMAEEYPDFEFVQEVLAQITWYHNIILMDKIKDIEQRKWYIKEIVKNGWSTNVLKMQIKNKVYERQAIADKITNFEKTLPNVQSDLAMQTLKDPYIFDFIALKGQIKEKEIENAMITKIKDVLLELRNRICFCRKSIQINC